MEYLLIWLGFAGVTALAAAARGRSAALWFAIGLVGGLFALIAVLVMRPGEVPAAPGAGLQGGAAPSDWSAQANASPTGPVVASHLGVLIHQHHAGFWALGRDFRSIEDARRHIEDSAS